MNCRILSVFALALCVVAGCSKTRESPSETPPAAEKASASKPTDAPPEQPTDKPAAAAVDGAVLADPSQATAEAPAEFVVELTTTKGPVRLDINRAWAPKGVDRFYNLVQAGYYTDVAFFRVIPGFMAQVGLHGDPAINRTWRSANIDDDPVAQSNTRGMVTFATAGPNTRTTQFFINFADNTRLDGMGFAPFARIQPESMKVVDALHGGYGEGAPRGKGPGQARIHAEGNAYLKAEFPELDYIQKATVVKP